MDSNATDDDLIDVHTHVVPRDFPLEPAAGDSGRWPCLCMHDPRRATIQFGNKPFRELDDRSWDLAARLRSMDAEGISAQVLSPMPELLSYWLPTASALALCRHVNDCIAGMVARGGGRFHGLGSVPLQEPALAARELATLRAQGLRGVEVGSNINGVMLADARFDEFFAEAERLGLAIFVHALHPIGADRLAAWPDLVPFAAFPLDTGLAAAALIRAGVPVRFPRLRLAFSHGGGALLPLVHRMQRGWEMSRGFDGLVPEPPRVYAAGFYYDSLVYDPGYLRYLEESLAPGHIFAGTDYPYVIEQTGLAEFLRAAGGAPGQRGRAARAFLGLD